MNTDKYLTCPIIIISQSHVVKHRNAGVQHIPPWSTAVQIFDKGHKLFIILVSRFPWIRGVLPPIKSKTVLLHSCCHRDVKHSTCSLPPPHALDKSYYLPKHEDVLFKESVWLLARGKSSEVVSAFHQHCLKRKLAAGVFLTRLVCWASKANSNGWQFENPHRLLCFLSFSLSPLCTWQLEGNTEKSLILTVIKGQCWDPPPWDIKLGLGGEGQLCNRSTTASSLYFY